VRVDQCLSVDVGGSGRVLYVPDTQTHTRITHMHTPCTHTHTRTHMTMSGGTWTWSPTTYKHHKNSHSIPHRQSGPPARWSLSAPPRPDEQLQVCLAGPPLPPPPLPMAMSGDVVLLAGVEGPTRACVFMCTLHDHSHCKLQLCLCAHAFLPSRITYQGFQSLTRF
jgi:hypothetical protein